MTQAYDDVDDEATCWITFPVFEIPKRLIAHIDKFDLAGDFSHCVTNACGYARWGLATITDKSPLTALAAEAELVRVLRETREQLDRVQGSDFDFDVDAALYEADRLLAKHGGGRPCRYCQNGQYTGLPGNACENCMNTGVEH